MTREIDQIEEVTFSLLAEENDMKAAEDAVLGTWDKHRSHLDWFAHDEDDEKPDPCDRIIQCRLDGTPHSHEVLADAFKIMAHLGPQKCYFRVAARGAAFWGLFESAGGREMSIKESVVSDALNSRIGYRAAGHSWCQVLSVEGERKWNYTDSNESRCQTMIARLI